MRHPSLRVQKTCLALVAACGSFVAIALLPLPEPSQPPSAVPIHPLKQGLDANFGFSSARQVQEAIAPFPAPENQLLFAAPEQFQGKILKEINLPDGEQVVALTFDDGPHPTTTEQVLNILKQYDIKATFFWIGKNLKNYPKIAEKVVAEGHAIGNHTWSHPYRAMSESAAAEEIEETAALIQQITGVKTYLFRPPGGMLENGFAAYARQQNYTVVLWSADAKDYRASTEAIAENVLRQVKSGAIVLLHDGGGDRGNTVEALPTIIEALKMRGYQFATVPDLLQMHREGYKPPAR